MTFRTFPKADGTLDHRDFGPMAHPPFVLDELAGIAVYRGQDGDIDYDSPVALMSEDSPQVVIPDQSLPPNTIWHYVRCRISACCSKRSDPSPPCVIRIDADGNMIGLAPNPPINLTASQLAAGKIILRWQYGRFRNEVEPTGFNVYIDSGDGFDLSEADAVVSYGARALFEWTSDALTHGQVYRFIVRSYKTDGGESQNQDHVAAVADAVGPAAISGLQVNWQEI